MNNKNIETFKETTDTNFVYFIQGVNGGRIKIGMSRHPKHRLHEMQFHSPLKLCIILKIRGSQKKEKMLHDRFSEYRDYGEWFNPSFELTSFIKEKQLEQSNINKEVIYRSEEEIEAQIERKIEEKIGGERRIVDVKDVYRIIKEADGEIDRSSLLRKAEIKANQLNDIEDILIEMEKIKKHKEGLNIVGRPKTIYTIR